MRQKRPKNGTSAISCMMTVTCKLFGRMFCFFFSKNFGAKTKYRGLLCYFREKQVLPQYRTNVPHFVRIKDYYKKKHIKRSIWPFVYLKSSCNFDNVFHEQFEAMEEPNGIGTIECFKKSFVCDNLCLCYPNGSASLKYTRLDLFDLE